MLAIWVKYLLPPALNGCPKCKKSHNMVTLKMCPSGYFKNKNVAAIFLYSGNNFISDPKDFRPLRLFHLERFQLKQKNILARLSQYYDAAILKWVTSSLFFDYFRSFSNKNYNFLPQTNVKNVHPGYGAGFQTKDLHTFKSSKFTLNLPRSNQIFKDKMLLKNKRHQFWLIHVFSTFLVTYSN